MSEDRTLPFPQPNPLRLPPRLAELRASAPVSRVTTPDGRTAWLVTSYETVATVLSDAHRFGVSPPGTPTGQNDSLLADGPAHSRLRRLVGKAFTSRSVANLRPRIEQLAAERVRAIATAGPPADLVSGLAAPLSITVIAELLGVEIADRERFRSMADAMSASDPFAYDADPEAGMRAWETFGSYVAELVAARRDRSPLGQRRNDAEPAGDDLLSRLIAVRDVEDGQLSDGDLVTLAGTIVAAGYLTASNAISIGTLLLFDVDGFRRLHDHPDELQHVVDEVLRMLSGLNGEAFPRWARQDVTLAGTEIAAGDQVLVRLGAANRDPARFAAPECLRSDRFAADSRERAGGPRSAERPRPADGPRPADDPEPADDPGVVGSRDVGGDRSTVATHLAFGRGPHYCLGASLARTEVTAALGALARDLPGLRLVGSPEELDWIRTQADTGPAALPVTW